MSIQHNMRANGQIMLSVPDKDLKTWKGRRRCSFMNTCACKYYIQYYIHLYTMVSKCEYTIRLKSWDLGRHSLPVLDCHRCFVCFGKIFSEESLPGHMIHQIFKSKNNHVIYWKRSESFTEKMQILSWVSSHPGLSYSRSHSVGALEAESPENGWLFQGMERATGQRWATNGSPVSGSLRNCHGCKEPSYRLGPLPGRCTWQGAQVPRWPGRSLAHLNLATSSSQLSALLVPVWWSSPSHRSVAMVVPNQFPINPPQQSDFLHGSSSIDSNAGTDIGRATLPFVIVAAVIF